MIKIDMDVYYLKPLSAVEESRLADNIRRAVGNAIASAAGVTPLDPKDGNAQRFITSQYLEVSGTVKVN